MKTEYKMAWSSEELKSLYEHTSSGHWFDKDTMRFFKSRLTENFRRLDDETALFITTEKAPFAESRRASVRIARLVKADNFRGIKVQIDTVGDFNALTLSRAKTVMKNYKGEKS